MIRNIIFDVGNVLVKWSPKEVIKRNFPKINPKQFFRDMDSTWTNLNLGKITLTEAVQEYSRIFRVPEENMSKLMSELKDDQTPIEGSVELLKELSQKDYILYSITDNVKEFISYHRINSKFPEYLKDITVSADAGFLKPDPRIYRVLLDKHRLIPHECVFIDDMIINVEGAKLVGMHSFQFKDTEQCREELKKLEVSID